MDKLDADISLGEDLFEEGKLDESHEIFERILQKDPKNHIILNNIGKIFYLKGETSSAKKYFFRSYSINNDNNDLLLNITDLYFNESQWDNGLPFLERYLENNNKDFERINQLASAYIELGNTRKAKQLLENSIEIHPDQDAIKEVLNTLKSMTATAGDETSNVTPSMFSTAKKVPKFSLFMFEAPSYKYSHFLYDDLKRLCYLFEAAGYDCCIRKNRLSTDRINMIFGGHLLNRSQYVKEIADCGDYIVRQTESLGYNDIINVPMGHEAYASIYLPLLKNAKVVFDNTPTNFPVYQRLGIEPQKIDGGIYYFNPQIEEIQHKKNKDIDFLFFGSLTPHRKKILEVLASRGQRVYVDFDSQAIYRNDLIARTRVNLALLQSPEANHFNPARTLYLVNNRCLVVGERSVWQEPWEHCFLSADTDKFMDLCMETIVRPDLDLLATEFYERYKGMDNTESIEGVHKFVEEVMS